MIVVSYFLQSLKPLPKHFGVLFGAIYVFLLAVSFSYLAADYWRLKRYLGFSGETRVVDLIGRLNAFRFGYFSSRYIRYTRLRERIAVSSSNLETIETMVLIAQRLENVPFRSNTREAIKAILLRPTSKEFTAWFDSGKEKRFKAPWRDASTLDELNLLAQSIRDNLSRLSDGRSSEQALRVTMTSQVVANF